MDVDQPVLSFLPMANCLALALDGYGSQMNSSEQWDSREHWVSERKRYLYPEKQLLDRKAWMPPLSCLLCCLEMGLIFFEDRSSEVFHSSEKFGKLRKEEHSFLIDSCKGLVCLGNPLLCHSSNCSPVYYHLRNILCCLMK